VYEAMIAQMSLSARRLLVPSTLSLHRIMVSNCSGEKESMDDLVNLRREGHERREDNDNDNKKKERRSVSLSTLSIIIK